MTALMSVESGSHNANRDEKVAVAIEACKKIGILILPPDINSSGVDFEIEKNEKSLDGRAIRWGFNAIKNVGSAAIENILASRENAKRFTSFSHFLIHVDNRKTNKKVLESLIKVGAMDAFASRASMLEQLEEIRNKVTQFDSSVDGQDHLFGDLGQEAQAIQDTFKRLPEYPQAELLSFEKELLGIYLTDHPLAQALSYVAEKAEKTVGELDIAVHKGIETSIGGVITRFRETVTKKSNAKMAFGTLDDQTGSIEFVIFPRTYEDFVGKLQQDMVALMRGKIDVREDTMQLIVEKITIPEENQVENSIDEHAHEVFIPRKTSQETLAEVGKILKSYPGTEKVAVVIPNGGAPKRMMLPYGVAWSEELQKRLGDLLK